MAASVKELQGRHVLGIIVAFFGAMLIANGIFIYLAVSTFNGIESEAYQKGLHYNQRIAAGREQAALGWSHKLGWGGDGDLVITVHNREGAPVTGLLIQGDIGRPVADRFNQPLQFNETAAGQYITPVTGLAPGSWVVTLTAAKAKPQPANIVYQIKERLWRRPPR